MSKKVIVITGSPRKDGNSNILARAFADAASGRGFDVKTVDAVELGALGCRACLGCYKTGKPCAFDNPFNDIADDILEADVIAFAMPVYWYTIPAQIKAVIDNIYCLYRIKSEELAGKKSVLLCCCAENDMEIFDGVMFAYERTAALNGWTRAGEVLVPGVIMPGDVEKSEGIKKAEELAASL